MAQEIKTINDLFDRIDDELIILSEAKQKGEYKWSYKFCTFGVGGNQLRTFGSIDNKSIVESGFYAIIYPNVPIF